MTSAADSAPDGFHEFYQSFWGERWPSLWGSLRKSTQVARRNLFSDLELPSPERLWNPDYPFLYRPGDDFAVRGPNQLLAYYTMDPASVFVAQLLGVRPGERVLDLCAAPGGKSLVLIESLWPDGFSESGEILLNELSMPRRERLKKVIQQYVPREIRSHVHLTGKDGGRFALTHPRSFDRILVDAPCSGEAHLQENPRAMSEWSVKRSKGLAQRQYALLTGALEALKPGGTLLYSTCSVSQLENEQVVARFLEKKGDRIEIDPLLSHAAGGEPYGGGLYFLPDRCGLGPLFVTRFKVKSSSGLCES